ncbi:hypothetical protein ACIRFH_33880 [Streptomyces sp. NPDC093586]
MNHTDGGLAFRSPFRATEDGNYMPNGKVVERGDLAVALWATEGHN